MPTDPYYDEVVPAQAPAPTRTRVDPCGSTGPEWAGDELGATGSHPAKRPMTKPCHMAGRGSRR